MDRRRVPPDRRGALRYRLDAGVTFSDASGRRWTAPIGTVTDGASIPGLFPRVPGPRLDERFLPAAIVHDAYCARDNEHLDELDAWMREHERDVA